ncbi:NAD(P)-dependent oxidoreductase [Mycoplasmatota bacterium zrk1]
MKIVMIEPLSVPKSYISFLSKRLIDDGHEFISCFNEITMTEKIARVKNADIIIVTNGKVSEELIEAAPNLKLISVGFTGVDHIPSICKEKKILICNSQGYATIPTAELAVTLMLMRTRNVIETMDKCRQGETKNGLVGTELSNKTVGIVGTGMIGKKIAKLLKGFDVKLLGYDILEDDEAKEIGIKYVPLKELFSNSDFISLHLPLTNSTKGLVNKELLDTTKEHAIIINCARGPIVDSDALVEAINNGKIRGAGVDVYEIEPPLPVSHKLLGNEKIYATPHIAFASKESMERRAEIVFNNIYSFLDGSPINVKSL